MRDELIRYARQHGGVLTLDARRAKGLSADDFEREVSALHLRRSASQLAAGGKAIRIDHGTYVVPDVHGRVSVLAVGAELVSDGFVSMWTAADHHDLTTSQPAIVSVVTTQRREPLKVLELNTTFFFHTTDKARMFGWQEEEIEGSFARVARVERLLIDLLWFVDAPDAPSPSETLSIWRTAAARGVNGAMLASYTQRMGSDRLARRVGYLMEMFGMRGHDRLLAARGSDRHHIALFTEPRGVSLPSSTTWRIRSSD